MRPQVLTRAIARSGFTPRAALPIIAARGGGWWAGIEVDGKVSIDFNGSAQLKLAPRGAFYLKIKGAEGPLFCFGVVGREHA